MDDKNKEIQRQPPATVTIYVRGKAYEVIAVDDGFDDEDEPIIPKSSESPTSKPRDRWAEVGARVKRINEKLKALGYSVDCNEYEREVLLVPDDKSKEIILTDWNKIESLLDTLAETGEVDERFIAR